MPKLKAVNPDVNPDVAGCFEATLARSLNLSRQRVPIHLALAKHWRRFSSLSPTQRKEAAATLRLEHDLRGSWVRNDPDAIIILKQQYKLAQQFVTPITRLPVEILADIFGFTLARDQPSARVRLMLVCQYWQDVVCRLGSCWSSLTLGKWTDPARVSEVLRRAGMRPLEITINTEDLEQPETSSGTAYLALIECMSSASQWRTLIVDSMPEADILNSSIASRLGGSFGAPLKQLQTFTISGLCEASPLLRPLLENVATAAVGGILDMTINSPSSLSYLVQPDYTAIFSSLTHFTAHIPRTHGTITVNPLPYLARLESLDLARIILPLDNSGADLPLTCTLRRLQLKSTSFEWMGGCTFPCLATCTITTPPFTPPVTIPTINLPACTELAFEGRQSARVGLFHAPRSSVVTLRDNSWNKVGGTKEIVYLLRGGWPVGLRPRALRLRILCRHQVLLSVLRENPQLETLSLELSRPGALSRGFFEALLARPVQQADGVSQSDWVTWAEQQSDWEAIVCPSLRSLDLCYERPSRISEPLEHLSVLLVVAWSRDQRYRVSNDFSLCVHNLHRKNVRLQLVRPSMQTLQCMGIVNSQAKFKRKDESVLSLMITSVLSRAVSFGTNTPLRVLTPFILPLLLKRLTQFRCQFTPLLGGMLDILPFFECLEHLKLSTQDGIPPYPITVDLPLVRTLQVLELISTSIRWLDGRVFGKLQSCLIRYIPDGDGVSTNFRRIGKVDRPVCHRMVYHDDYIESLSAFHLPVLEELSVAVSRQDRPNLNESWTAGVLPVLNLFQPRVLSISILPSKWSQELLGMLQRMQGLQGLRVWFTKPALWTYHTLENLFMKNGTTDCLVQHVLPNSSAFKAIDGHASSEPVIPHAELVDFTLSVGGPIKNSAQNAYILLCERFIEARKRAQQPLQSCKIVRNDFFWEDKPGLELISSHESPIV